MSITMNVIICHNYIKYHMKLANICLTHDSAFNVDNAPIILTYVIAYLIPYGN